MAGKEKASKCVERSQRRKGRRKETETPDFKKVKRGTKRGPERLEISISPPVKNPFEGAATKTTPLEQAINLLVELAGHTFSVDGTPKETRRRYSERATAQMALHMRYLFRGTVEHRQELADHHLMFTQMVFAMVCENANSTSVFAQRAPWYQETVTKGLLYDHQTRSYYLSHSFLKKATAAKVEAKKQASRLSYQEEKRTAQAQFRLRQAQRAKELVTDLTDLAARVALAIIDRFPTIEPKPPFNRTKTAAEAVKAELDFTELRRHGAVAKGVARAREALEQAYDELNNKLTEVKQSA